MLKYALLAAMIAVPLAGIFFLWQFWRKFKSIPDDEVIGEERTAYMRRRLTWIAVCVGAEIILQISNFILRTLEVI
jgi:hypothetical protein